MGNEATLNQLVNEQEKAVFKSMRTDMETGKAVLNVEQLGYFLREATLDNTILREVGINGRVLTNGYDVNGETDPEIPAADVDFGANELDVKKLKAMCEIEDDEKEDNMTQAQFEQTLLQMMGERIGEDLEYWALFADSEVARSDDPLLNTNDGWLKKCANP